MSICAHKTATPFLSKDHGSGDDEGSDGGQSSDKASRSSIVSSLADDLGTRGDKSESIGNSCSDTTGSHVGRDEGRDLAGKFSLVSITLTVGLTWVAEDDSGADHRRHLGAGGGNSWLGSWGGGGSWSVSATAVLG